MQQFLGDPESGHLDLESHCLALAIATKTLHEKRFKHTKKTIDHTPHHFKISNRVYFKNKQPEKWDLKWRAGYRIVCIEHNGYYLHIENQAAGKIISCNVKGIAHELPVELWNVDTKFGRGGKFINHPESFPTYVLNKN